MIRVDLHSHSNASDGALSPVELYSRARASGVAQWALTDHDTVAGLHQLRAAMAAADGVDSGVDGCVNSDRENDGEPLELVSGVELSLRHGRCDLHVLGLWIDIDSEPLSRFLRGQQDIRRQRAEKIDRRLQRVGIVGALAAVESMVVDGGVPARPHFARYLLEAGHCDKPQQAYRRWLGQGKPCYVACDWPSLEEGIAAIHAAGGVAVLAHPDKYGLTASKLRQLLVDFKAAAGDGIELISGRQLRSTTETLLRLSHKYQLACSSGSDFHAPQPHGCDIGTQAVLPSTAVPIWQFRGEKTAMSEGQP